MRDVVLATQSIGPPRIGAPEVISVIGPLGFVRSVVSVGEFVVLRFRDPRDGDAEPALAEATYTPRHAADVGEPIG